MIRNSFLKARSIMSGLCLSIVLLNAIPVFAASYNDWRILYQVPVHYESTNKVMLFSIHQHNAGGVKIYAKRQSSAGVGSSKWTTIAAQDLGAPSNAYLEPKKIAAAKDKSGNPWVFCIGSPNSGNKRIFYRKWNGSSFTSWAAVNWNGGYDYIEASSAVNSTSPIQLFTRDNLGCLWYLKVDINGNVTSYQQIGSTGPKIALMKNNSNCLEVYAIAPIISTTNSVWCATQSSPGGNFGSFSQIGPVKEILEHFPFDTMADIKCLINQSGNREVYVRLVHMDAPVTGILANIIQSNGIWEDHDNTIIYGYLSSAFEVAKRPDGVIELIYSTDEVVDPYGCLYVCRLYRPLNSSEWLKDPSDPDFGRLVCRGNVYLTINNDYKNINIGSLHINRSVNYLELFSPNNFSLTDIKFNSTYYNSMWETRYSIR